MASSNIYNNSGRKKEREKEKTAAKTTTVASNPREGLPMSNKKSTTTSSKSSSSAKSSSSKGGTTSSKSSSTGSTSKRTAYDREESKAKSSIKGSFSTTKSGKTREQILAELDNKINRTYTYDANDGKRDFLDRIGNLTADFRRNKDLQRDAENAQYNLALADIQQRPDFMDLANKGAGKASRVNFGNNRFGNTMMGQTVGTPEVRKQYANYLQENTISQNPFAYMTDRQKNIYNAFIGLGDRQSAQRYLASIETDLQQQAAAKAMENMPDVNYQTRKEYEATHMARDWNGNYVPGPGSGGKEYNRWEELGKAINLAQISAQSQAQSAITGMKQIGQDEAVAPNYTELMYEQLRPTLSGTAGVISDVAGSVGFMLPAVAVSALTGGAGQVISAGLFAAASGGRTYNQMLREDPTVDKFSAKTYSIINGALEGTLQYALGGIGKLGGKIGLTKLVGKAGLNAALAKKLLNVAQASANTPAVQRLVRTLTAAGQYGSGMADEAIEEWLQAVIDPAVRNVIFDENNKIQPFSEDKLYAAMLGALGAAVMNAPSTVSNYKNADATLNNAIIRNAIKDAKAKGNTNTTNVPELTEEELAAYGNDPDIAELATEIARLEEELPNRKKHQQDKAQKHINDLKKRLANLVEKKAKNQETAPGESNVPLPPPAPTADQGLGLINMALGEDVDNMGNYARTQPGEEGRSLIGAGIRNGTEGIIIPTAENVRPTGERINNTQARGMRPGDMRRQNVQNSLAQRQAAQEEQTAALSPEESMVEDYFGQIITDTLNDYQSGEIDAELAQGWVSGKVEQFRNYARNVLGWTEEQIEAQIASWNAPAELMEKPQPKFPKPENKWRQTRAKPVQQEATAETNKVTKEDLERQLAEKEEQVRQLEEQARANAEEIKRRTEEAQQPVETATEENEEYTAEELVEKFRADMKEAQTLYRSQTGKAKRDMDDAQAFYRGQMNNAEYNRYVKNLIDLFRSDAEKAGMSLVDIETEIASLGNDTQQNTVTDEDIDEALGTKEETKQPSENQNELRDVFDALDNDEITTDQAYDEVTAMLNQEDAQRTAGEEAQLGEYNNKPQVTVTDGRIEIKFPKYADKETRQKLKEAGFQWDRTAKVWWGGENNSNRALVEELTGVKLTEDEFTPEVKRILKEGVNGRTRKEGSPSVLREASQRETGDTDSRRVQRISKQFAFYSDVQGKATTEFQREHEQRFKIVSELFKDGHPHIESADPTTFADYQGDADGVTGERISLRGDYYVIGDGAIDWLVDNEDPAYQRLGKELQAAKERFNEELEANGVSPGETGSPTLKFYINERPQDVYFNGSSELAQESYCAGYFDDESNTLWLNASGGIAENVPHEYLHSRLLETGMYDNILVAMDETGLSESDLRRIVNDYVIPEWGQVYGPISYENGGFNNDNFIRYAQEIMCDLYARNRDTANYLRGYLSSNGSGVTVEELQDAVIDAVRSTPVKQNAASDTKYLELAKDPDANKKWLSTMVLQAARENGFDSPLLLHGTPRTGWTKVDVGYSDDKRTFFATSNSKIARTYAEGAGRISLQEATDKDRAKRREELLKAVNEAADRTSQLAVDYRDKVDELVEEFTIWAKENGFSEITRARDQNSWDSKKPPWFAALRQDGGFDRDFNEFARSVLTQIYEEQNPNPSPTWIDDDFGFGLDEINYERRMGAWVNENIKGEFGERLRNICYNPELDSIQTAIDSAAFDFMVAREALDAVTDAGMYGFYADTSNMLVIDHKHGQWYNIPAYLLADQDGEYPYTKLARWYANKTGQQDVSAVERDIIHQKFSTRDVASFAEYAGYSGVIIKGVQDSKNVRATKEPADIYIFLNPQQQVKSADPVTYDKNGNVIPLSQRFNRAHRDLRRAQRRTSSTFSPNKSGEVPVENMIPGIKEIWESLPDSVKEHMTKHLADINAEAWKNIMKKGGVDAVSGTLLKAKNWNAPQLEMAVEVGKYLADNGETDRAADIFTKVAAQQTDFGRAIKYLQTLQMYMPKVASAITHSIANDLGVELSKEEQDNIKLCDRIIEQGFISNSVMNKATGDFKEWLNDARDYVDRGLLDPSTAAYAAAMTLVTDKVPSTARQKFRALQRISLLSNPKTHFRNILGNLAEQTGAIMSRPVADMVDRALSKVTGERTFGSGGLSAIANNFASSIDQAVMDKKLGTSTIDNKFDEENASNGLKGLVRQKAFNEHTGSELRNTVNKAANAVDEAIGFGLSLGDAPFLITSYEAALAQVMNANPELLVDGEATDEMKEMAWDVSQRRTFRDRNGVVKSLNKIRDALGIGGDTIAPYVTTPVNVVLTAIQYSPIAFGEAFCKALIGDNSLNAKLKRGENIMKTQRQIAELVGRGALGTALMLVGSLLRAAGKITGDDDDIDSQKEKNWNKAVGRMGSSIKVGDTYIDPSSLQSLSTPIMAGAAAYESRNDDEDGTDWGGIFGAAAKASMKMGNTMLEMPVLQGVADLLGGNYDDGELLAGALSLAGNAVTQLVPFGSVLKQGAKAVDPYSRVQSEINAGPVERVAKSTVNNLRSMTPWGRKKLSERYDVLGNPIKNDASDNTAERLYNSFINPFNTSKENANDVTEEIDRLYASLQDTAVLPSAAGNSISYGGEKYKFTSADKQEYQRVEGESNAEILSKLVNSDAYDRLSDEEKAKVLSSVYDYSANKAKANYLKKQGVDYESDAKWMDSIDEIVKTGVDVGDAMVYRFELSNIKGSDDQVFYIDSLPLNSDQKDTIDEAFVDKYRSSYIDEDRDYTNADTLALSMTSDSGREKYNNRFSHSWRGVSGNYYDAMTGEEFGHFYDAYNSASKADDRVAAIKKMLMDMYGYNESYAYTMAYDFRKYYAAKYD